MAMAPDLIVIRHAMSGAPHLLAKSVKCAVINAGDGAHEHPTQGLLDLLTIRQRKGRLDGLEVAIIGDIAHSRVARSACHGLIHHGQPGSASSARHPDPPLRGMCLGATRARSMEEAVAGGRRGDDAQGPAGAPGGDPVPQRPGKYAQRFGLAPRHLAWPSPT